MPSKASRKHLRKEIPQRTHAVYNIRYQSFFETHTACHLIARMLLFNKNCLWKTNNSSQK